MLYLRLGHRRCCGKLLASGVAIDKVATKGATPQGLTLQISTLESYLAIAKTKIETIIWIAFRAPYPSVYIRQ